MRFVPSLDGGDRLDFSGHSKTVQGVGAIMSSTPINLQPSIDPVQSALQRFFGYSTFRSPQRDIVECLLQKQDALIVLPTGGGKSICFQLPALLQPGLTLVVSPLVALMENQVQELRHKQLPAALLHSELSRSHYRQTLWQLANQKLRLLYLSPESLLNPKVWEILSQPTLMIHALIIDEAHCLALWGDTFRPAYYRLGAVRRTLRASRQADCLSHPSPAKMAVAAFTATADSQTQHTIQRILQLENPRHFRVNPYRADLHLAIQTVWTPRQRQHQLLTFIQRQPHQSGLVYVRTRQDSETLATWLTQAGFHTAAYHAGLTPPERRSTEQQWLTGALQFVVSTNAFGMGIDKPNVRWIAHFHPPLLLSEYLQEVGRAGRDGNPATALMLVSEPTGWLDGTDKHRQQFFVHQLQRQYRMAKEVIRKLPPEGEVATVSRQFKDGAIALSLLHQLGHLEWTDPFHYVIRSRSPLSHLGQSNQQATRQMRQYITTRGCRWQFLLHAFGFEAEAQGFQCGHCDNCQS
ncbi:MAG: RecQ family ATP-dependent DNA helicase [Leptolyngbyaceae cyanobacterium bins.349]|nr:RecQ family ATP-dependent DNA helicase [Leptolyngbyaceae cyanobacterium bins.349]